MIGTRSSKPVSGLARGQTIQNLSVSVQSNFCILICLERLPICVSHEHDPSWGPLLSRVWKSPGSVLPIHTARLNGCALPHKVNFYVASWDSHDNNLRHTSRCLSSLPLTVHIYIIYWMRFIIQSMHSDQKYFLWYRTGMCCYCEDSTQVWLKEVFYIQLYSTLQYCLYSTLTVQVQYSTGYINIYCTDFVCCLFQ